MVDLNPDWKHFDDILDDVAEYYSKHKRIELLKGQINKAIKRIVDFEYPSEIAYNSVADPDDPADTLENFKDTIREDLYDAITQNFAKFYSTHEI